MREKLESLINNIKASQIRIKLIELITSNNEDNYNKAFLFACKTIQYQTDYIEDPLFQFISLLVSQQEFPINLNIWDTNRWETPVWYAATNRHPELYHLLAKSGAELNRKDRLGKTPVTIHMNEFAQLSGLFDKIFDTKFKVATEQLDAKYIKLKASDKAKSTTDKDRILCILPSLDYLINHLPWQVIPQSLQLDACQKYFLEIYSFLFVKNNLKHIFSLINKISPSLQAKYNDHFHPAGSSWITLRQFGYLLEQDGIATTITNLSVEGSEQDYSCFGRLYSEVIYKDDILNHALRDIIQRDLPNLRNFFHQLFAAEYLKLNSINKAPLLTIKTLTSRMMDNEIILKLMSLLDFADMDPMKPKGEGLRSDIFLVFTEILKPDQSLSLLNLSTNIGRFAALRRLELIGELITGKNFSNSLLALDTTVSWRSFIEIRDTLVHQDEGDNQHKVETLLLSNVDLLKDIMANELPLLFNVIHQLVKAREQAYFYTPDSGTLWEYIRDLAVAQDELKKQTVIQTQPEIQRRVGVEDQDRVINALKSKGAPEDLIDECAKFLDGSGAVPERKIQGSFKKFFPQRNENKAEFTALSEILDKAAANKDKKSEAERNKERSELQTQKKLKELAIQNGYVGFDRVRQLAADFITPPQKGHLLTWQTRILAAKKAIEDARSCLFESGYFVQDLPFKTINQWDNFHVQNGSLILVELLIKNKPLFYALSFCIAQSLQHLEKIREYMNKSKIDFSNHFMILQNDTLRETRNYIEHPALYLNLSYLLESVSKEDQSYAFQKWFAPRVISIMFHLDDDLSLIEEKLLNFEKSQSTQTSYLSTANNRHFKIAVEESDDDVYDLKPEIGG